MHIVTFYSYKGGVGRTLALMNCAYELATRGKKVLVVDFDLEAPGLSSFAEFKDAKDTLGIVDYITEYRETNKAPKIGKFLCQSGEFRKGTGALWLMPAGLQNNEYSAKLHSIDWKDLYALRSGYLLLEDLKDQWREQLNPDYVLIDSRTGHTDVEGICTRQLPDSVVALFFPNDQNIFGLAKTVAAIRREGMRDPQRAIQIYFVASNVHEATDELGILQQQLKLANDSFVTSDEIQVIHHISSISFLKEDIFVKLRKKSKLSKQYLELADRIVRGNLEDTDGAMAVLKDMRNRKNHSSKELLESENTIEKITNLHSNDTKVLFALALIRQEMGNHREAIFLLNRSIANGATSSKYFMVRALSYRATNEDSAALSDIIHVLEMQDASEFDLIFAARWLVELRPILSDKIGGSPLLPKIGPEAKLQIAADLLSHVESLSVAVSVYRLVEQDPNASVGQIATAVSQRHMALLGLKQFSEVAQGLEYKVNNQLDAFNLAIALWGERGQPPIELFADIATKYESLNSAVATNPNPNLYQRMAVTFGVLRQTDRARIEVAKSHEALSLNPRKHFSVWRYLEVYADDFAKDLNVLEGMILEGKVVPYIVDDTKADLSLFD